MPLFVFVHSSLRKRNRLFWYFYIPTPYSTLQFAAHFTTETFILKFEFCFYKFHFLFPSTLYKETITVKLQHCLLCLILYSPTLCKTHSIVLFNYANVSLCNPKKIWTQDALLTLTFWCSYTMSYFVFHNPLQKQTLIT